MTLSKQFPLQDDGLNIYTDEAEVLSSNGSNEGKVDPRNTLNELTAKQWIPETVSVWMQRGLGANHPEAQIDRQHPAPFSFTDVSRLIVFFTKTGEIVFDPFVGVGSTLKACALENRHGIGFELNPKYVAIAEKRIADWRERAEVVSYTQESLDLP